MMKNIKISIIIPAFNAADTIARAVGSLLVQDFESIEIILVDDGSTDETYAICEELSASDMRITVIRKENGGVSSARNAGLDVARGEYVMFLDSDDVLHPDAIGKMYAPGFDFISGGFEKVVGSVLTYSCVPAATGEFIGDCAMGRFFDVMIAKKHCYLLNSSCFKLYRRTLLERLGLRFNAGLDYGEDKMFVMNFLCHVERARTVSSVVYSYIIREGSLSSDESSDRHLEGLIRLMKAYQPVLACLNERFLSKRLASLYHTDMVGRYVFRILTQFVKRQSDLLTIDNLQLLYDYMAKDDRLGLFNVRFAQIPNVILYRIGNVGLSLKIYKLISRR